MSRFISASLCSRIFTLTVTGLLLVGQPAKADQEPFQTIITPQTAPVALTRCASTHEYSYVQGSTSAVNRSNVFLASYTVRWKFYDHSGNIIVEGNTVHSSQSNVAPGDNTSNQQQVDLTGTLHFADVGRVRCRLQSAKFEGGKIWTYGKVWHGKLSPISAQ